MSIRKWDKQVIKFLKSNKLKQIGMFRDRKYYIYLYNKGITTISFKHSLIDACKSLKNKKRICL